MFLKKSVRDVSKTLTPDDLRAWLVAAVVKQLRLSSDSIDTATPLLDYGLDSIQAAALSGRLEKLLRRRLSPTMIWDYPSIDELVQYLSSEAS